MSEPAVPLPTMRFVDLQTTLEALLDCAVEDLAPTVGRAIINPGEVPWDCEQVWVRVIGVGPIYPTGAGARSRIVSGAHCGPVGWSVTLGVGVIRCVAVVDDQGRPPPAATMTADGAVMTADMLALMNAIECCGLPHEHSLGGWRSLGPEGGYAGGEWSVTMTFLN